MGISWEIEVATIATDKTKISRTGATIYGLNLSDGNKIISFFFLLYL